MDRDPPPLAPDRTLRGARVPHVLPLRRQAEVTDAWLRARLRLLLPDVMRRAGIDLWIVVARENNEDPVLASLLPSPMLSARRRTILVFHAPEGGESEALAIAKPGAGLDGVYLAVWSGGDETMWDCLRRVVAERDPQRIGIDVSSEVAHADGLTKHEHDALLAALGEPYAGRLVGAERLVIGWLERRLPEEIEAAAGSNALAHAIIAEAFSGRAVYAGVTTADDLAWWLRQRAWDLGLPVWFHPTVSIQRRGEAVGPIGATPDAVIRRGDLLHCDFGVHHLGLATDTQHLGYVLRLGETEPPAGLTRALAVANRQQDLVAAAMVVGRTGNEILRDAVARMAEAGIRGRVYSHPIGYHGHGAGPTIGLYDQQGDVPVRGDVPLVDDCMLALEMLAEVPVAEWDDQVVTMATETTVAVSGGRVVPLAGRQTALHVIG